MVLARTKQKNLFLFLDYHLHYLFFPQKYSINGPTILNYFYFLSLLQNQLIKGFFHLEGNYFGIFDLKKIFF